MHHDPLYADIRIAPAVPRKLLTGEALLKRIGWMIITIFTADPRLAKY